MGLDGNMVGIYAHIPSTRYRGVERVDTDVSGVVTRGVESWR